MIQNITYKDKRVQQKINDYIGESFSFIDRIKMGGIGCAKLQIKEASPDISRLILTSKDTSYCNLELKQKGLCVGFNSHMRIYAWCIPYHFLNIYFNGGLLSIYGPSNHLKVQAPFNGSIDKKFLKKVLHLKNEVRGDDFYS